MPVSGRPLLIAVGGGLTKLSMSKVMYFSPLRS